MKTFFYALLGFLAISSFSSAAKKAKDWSKVDFDKVEDEWKEGDSEEELITPDELLFREMERRKAAPLDVNGPLDAETVRHQQSSAGPAMMFVQLRPKDESSGVPYSESELVELSGVWKELLWTGGLEVSFYNIDTNKMLVSLQKGWDGGPVRDFLLDQAETVKVTWDQHDYLPEDRHSDVPSPSKKKKPSKKSKKKKKKE